MKPAPFRPSPRFFDRLREIHQALREAAMRALRLSGEDPERSARILRALRGDVRNHFYAVEQTLEDTLLVETLDVDVHDEILRERELRVALNRIGDALARLPAHDPRWRPRALAFLDLFGLLFDLSDRHLLRWRRDFGPEESRILALRYRDRLGRAERERGGRFPSVRER